MSVGKGRKGKQNFQELYVMLFYGDNEPALVTIVREDPLSSHKICAF